ncbi:hypothetical protein EIP86_005675 [Pleurotus ostreatoroseus]|nr:hypothetical protein EIP86_005675 [Pleurotus ostreatoroseus]
MSTSPSNPARRHTLFRPCIDIHDGKVKQIVGGTLNAAAPGALRTNFVASHPPAHYAALYRDNALEGGHVIMLGRGEENVQAAREAVGAWPVTSYLFPDAKFSLERLQKLASMVGKDKLVVDVSCRRRGDKWFVAMDKWQRITEMEVCKESLDLLSQYCSEFLVHAADVEGLCQGIDEDLVRRE